MCGTNGFVIFFLKAFSRYQMQQITTEFMDTFGIDEEEFQDPDDSIAYVLKCGVLKKLISHS